LFAETELVGEFGMNLAHYNKLGILYILMNIL